MNFPQIFIIVITPQFWKFSKFRPTFTDDRFNCPIRSEFCIQSRPTVFRYSLQLIRAIFMEKSYNYHFRSNDSKLYNNFTKLGSIIIKTWKPKMKIVWKWTKYEKLLGAQKFPYIIIFDVFFHQFFTFLMPFVMNRLKQS